MGKLVEIKTKENSLNVEDFINAVIDEEKRKDSFVLLKLMQKATKENPKMWVAQLSALAINGTKALQQAGK